MAFIKVEGIVDKPLGDSGFIILETIRLNDGRTFDKKWKVWTKDTIPAFSSFVECVGEFTAKANEYTAYDGSIKHGIDLNINNPKVTVLRAAETASPDVVSDWATPTTTEPAPF